ncbi:MAG: C-GCAxxG-C-C family protein [Dehalococcoidales bacterium]|jgi:C_GCAxxG_C_C family probable redox protein|nr:C-GCAxxG-C-C family protein [Dehalococcoidales bacterium]
MSRVGLAVSGFGQGLNCCQAVLSTYGPRFGLDRELALKVTSGLGGGIGHLGETCGVVTGALMVIGLKHGGTVAGDEKSREKTFSLISRFLEEFKARRGSILCRELLGYDISIPEGLQAVKDKGLFSTLCPNLVRDSAEILEQIL